MPQNRASPGRQRALDLPPAGLLSVSVHPGEDAESEMGKDALLV